MTEQKSIENTVIEPNKVQVIDSNLTSSLVRKRVIPTNLGLKEKSSVQFSTFVREE